MQFYKLDVDRVRGSEWIVFKVSEYRNVREKEWFFDAHGGIRQCDYGTLSPCPVLVPVNPNHVKIHLADEIISTIDLESDDDNWFDSAETNNQKRALLYLSQCIKDKKCSLNNDTFYDNRNKAIQYDTGDISNSVAAVIKALANADKSLREEIIIASLADDAQEARTALNNARFRRYEGLWRKDLRFKDK